ncbi:D-alanyl-D-alanine carboxypeptidase family protein [Methylovirgula sp. 4M-Z18]|uniref:D-alanyl-D-alanine carboxypeptidase family protein n=1 Tax=Methylovirgula sp. 4M-Z18 TaxID=2293567 RepID=UPI000E2EBE59|nr:D-alanyl-D-alanine carboxypeptidase family protein [Methylovirgula sp. 4M-Z18]RFB75015.1 D-alanyl-D-alanine carboxypeptidase [Methylovirgula sp. 4M-Z18]
MIRALLLRLSVSVAALAAVSVPALANPAVVVDADSGQVLYSQDATRPWYPASITKLMTVYVALNAVREGRMTMDTPMIVSARAARMPPSKMGFRPGTEVTLDNALKMLMVKSANDLAITVAEGVDGSVEGFAGEMNRTAAKLGMQDSHFVNPNGLPAADHYTSARDMAILARALYADFPDEAGLYDIGALELNGRIIANHNGLLGRYPGADGMKTGFTCAAGFNVVASATHGSRHLIAVVLGSPSAKERNARAADLLENAFGSSSGSGSLESLSPVGGSPPDMHGTACAGHHGNYVADLEDDSAAINVSGSDKTGGRNFFLFGGTQSSGASGMEIASRERPVFTPEHVYIGPAPGWTGAVAGASPGTKRGKTDANAEPAATTAYAQQKAKINGNPLSAEDPYAQPLRLVEEPAKKGAKAKVAHVKPHTKLAQSEAKAPQPPVKPKGKIKPKKPATNP